MINNPLALIISYIAVNLPFCIYTLLGYLDTIPRDLDDAARIDGVTMLQIIFRVILPA
ncbi:MAG: ABC transporter permease subunit, partial [Candidatus Devosia euplotis]|nr:ABC transporter permease subunit [Candidatus Devosia euplotis]